MKEKTIFSKKKNVSRPSNPPDELAENVSKKKNSLSGELSPSLLCKSSESGRFSIIHMIRIRFFGPGELIQNYFRAAQYAFRPRTLFPTREFCSMTFEPRSKLQRCQRFVGDQSLRTTLTLSLPSPAAATKRPSGLLCHQRLWKPGSCLLSQRQDPSHEFPRSVGRWSTRGLRASRASTSRFPHCKNLEAQKCRAVQLIHNRSNEKSVRSLPQLVEGSNIVLQTLLGTVTAGARGRLAEGIA